MKYRQAIISEWENSFIGEQDMESSSEKESVSDSMEEEICRMQVLYPKNDCGICSDRAGERETTVYICLNSRCMVS